MARLSSTQLGWKHSPCLLWTIYPHYGTYRAVLLPLPPNPRPCSSDVKESACSCCGSKPCRPTVPRSRSWCSPAWCPASPRCRRRAGPAPWRAWSALRPRPTVSGSRGWWPAGGRGFRAVRSVSGCRAGHSERSAFAVWLSGGFDSDAAVGAFRCQLGRGGGFHLVGSPPGKPPGIWCHPQWDVLGLWASEQLLGLGSLVVH